MNNMNNTLEERIAEETEKNVQSKILNEVEVRKAITEAIFKVFPTEIRDIKQIIQQYDKAVKSNVLSKFEYFDFEDLEEKLSILEEINTMTTHLALGAKEVTNTILYQKNEMEKTSNKWIRKIEDKGIKNLNAEKILGREIDALEQKLEDVKKSKNDIFSIQNMLIVLLGALTMFNTYKLYF